MLVVVPKFIRGWHVPDSKPVVRRTYPKQQASDSDLLEATEKTLDIIWSIAGDDNAKQIQRTVQATTVEKQSSYPFVSGTTCAASGRTGGEASGIKRVFAEVWQQPQRTLLWQII